MTPTTPINANIPLEGKPVQVPNVLDEYGKVLSIQGAQQNMLLRNQELQNSQLANQTNALNLQQTQKKVAGMNAEADSYKNRTVNGVTDTDAVFQDLMDQNHPEQALDFRSRQLAAKKSMLDQQEQGIKIHKDNLDTAQKGLDLFGQIANPVIKASSMLDDNGQPLPTPPGETPKKANLAALDQAYQTAYAQGVQAKLVNPSAKPGDADYMPPSALNSDGTVNMDAIRGVRGHAASAVTAQQQVADERANAEYMLSVTNAQRAAATSAPDTAEKWMKFGGGVLKDAQTPDQWATGLSILQSAGMPKSILASYDPTFSASKDAKGNVIDSSATRAARMAIPAGEAVTEANRAAEIKHGQQMETIAQQNANTRSRREKHLDDTVSTLAQDREDRIANSAIDNKKSTAEKNINADVDKRAAAAIKPAGYTTPQQALADADKPLGTPDKNNNLPPGTLDKRHYAAAQAVKQIYANGAQRLQQANDAYTGAIRARGGTATDLDVNPRTLEYTERATPAGNAPAEAAPQKAAPPLPPKSVTDALPAGTHTFQNGQTWQKNADGTVQFVSQK